MSVIKELKGVALSLRKNRSPIAPTFQFHIAEIEKIGKSKGNRLTTEDEAINYIKKAITVCESNIEITDQSDDQKIQFGHEKHVLLRLLPQMITEDELRTFVEAQGDVHKGLIMKAVKLKYGALADMKFVSTLV